MTEKSEPAKAYGAARKLEALDAAPACGIDCEGFHGCARGYESTDTCFEAGRKWPNENTRECECGSVIPVEDARYDGDGNYICRDCIANARVDAEVEPMERVAEFLKARR
jgi:hypothetical protein